MKTLRSVLLLAALLGLAAGTALASAETKWTPAQQEVAAGVHAWEVASLAGNVDAIMRLTAPGFMGWDLAKPAPVDRAAYRAEQATFFGQFKVLECALPVTAIQIAGDTAAVHGRYRETVQDPTGARMQLQGSWTASLHRAGKEWLFLSLACLAASPATDEAAIKAEVARAMSAFVAACEKADLAGALAFMADVPEFRYADPEGKLLGFAATKQGLAEWFGQCSARRVLTARQAITVLGPDAALVQWHGALELVLKDGKTLRADPYSASFLFRRIGDAWKIAYQHESGPPPQPVGATQPPANVEAQLRAADAELVAAANARDLERWLACFEDSARMFPPDGPPIAVKTTFRPAAEELMRSPAFAVMHRVDGIEVSPCGTLAWIDYAFELTTPGPDGQPTTETGRDTTLYRRGSDSRWRVVADLWRPHAPATGD